MNSVSPRRFWSAAVSSGLTMFLLAGLWNLIVFPNLGIMFAPGLLREVPIFPLIIFGYITLGAALAFIGTHSQFSPHPRRHWIIAGALVMEVAFALSGLALQGTYNFPLEAIPYDLLWYVVEGVAGGLIASLFLRNHHA